MDLQYLRSATRPEHEATEAAMPLLGPDLTREDYAAVLSCLLPVLSSWESWAGEHAPARLRSFLAARRRSHWIEQDLASLNAGRPSAGELPVPIAWSSVVLEPGETESRCPAREFEAGFLGALYVLEGSTLGGRFLAKQVEASLGLLPGQGNVYFQGHGAATGALWREVTTEIAAVPDSLSERLVRSARRTFAIFGRALEPLSTAVSPRPSAKV